MGLDQPIEKKIHRMQKRHRKCTHRKIIHRIKNGHKENQSIEKKTIGIKDIDNVQF
jgi:hypothetical protein